MLLEAVATLKVHHPALRLIIVGDGPDRGELEKQVVELGIADSVIFTGYLSQKDVARRLEDADIFVLPSFAEGVPVVLMEALASRRPVVATRVAGVPELVEDGVSGFLVPAGDPRSLADRLDRLLGDGNLRGRMGEAGRAKVIDEFDATYEAARLMTLIRSWRLDNLAPELRPTPYQS